MSMTLEEAIKVLNNFPIDFRNSGGFEAMEALKIAILALRPVSREQVERMRGEWMHEEAQSNNSVTGYFKLPECECSNCGCIVQQEANFCPHCGEPKTDEAVQMVMERLEALRDNHI